MVIGSANIGATMDKSTTLKPPSSSVGDYLKAIWELSGGRRGLHQGGRRPTLGLPVLGIQHVRALAGDGSRRTRALPGRYANRRGTCGSPAAAAPPPTYRDLSLGVP